MGERAQVGALIYNVFETQWHVTLGEGPSPRVPTGRFLLVRMSVVNSGSHDVPVPSVSLVDDDGNLIDELPSGEKVPNWMGIARTVHPAESEQGNLVFDVQPRHYRLKVSDEDAIKFAYVDLPLNLNEPRPNSIP
jgi:hypothetical protein